MTAFVFLNLDKIDECLMREQKKMQSNVAIVEMPFSPVPQAQEPF